LWLGEGNGRVQDFWVATLAATTLKRFYRWRRENAPNQSHQPTTSQMVRNHKELRAGAVGTIYSWSAKGQQFYGSQWVMYRRSTEGRATVSAGLDALRRGVNASWFEWLEGSSPFFWNWPVRYQKEV
jgi:hypothetical protein